MEFLKGIAGKLVTGALALTVIAAAVSWYTADPATRSMLLGGTGRVISWLGIVLALPWATFALIGWVARRDSNLAGGILVLGYTLLEAVGIAWLFHWSLPGITAWAFLVLGGLFAAVYNLFACDWIAEKVA